jgi:hypothetical protein
LLSADAHAWTATIIPIAIGMVAMIRISIIENHGSPIGASGDGSDLSPAISGMA